MLSDVSKELLRSEIPETAQGMVDFRKYAIAQVITYKKQIERLEFIIGHINSILPDET